MIQVTPEYKKQVITELLNGRERFSGSDAQYAKQYGINGSIYSRIKSGDNLDGLLRDSKYLEIGQKFNVNITAGLS